MVYIKQQLVPPHKREATFGTGNPQTKMVVHQTGNRGRGANAKMHAKLQQDGFPASWHIQSDDVDIIQSWPFTYQLFHASTGDRPNGGNLVGIGWEICINEDADYYQSLVLASKGIAQVMRQVGMPMSGLTTHNAEDWKDHKWCPAQILNGVQGITWPKFEKMVRDEYNKLSGTASTPSGIERVEQDTGSFITNDVILVRDRPSVSGNHIQTFKKEEVLDVYDKVHYGNGYVWLEYTRPGKKPPIGFLPIRTYSDGEYGKMWGKIGEIGRYKSSNAAPTAPAKPKPKKDNKGYRFSGEGHVEGKGWIPMVGNTIGTVGLGKRLEAFSLTVKKGDKYIPVFGEIHLQGLGDVSVHTNVLGTVGEKRRMEAVKLDIADDIQYRVHMQNKGWSSWTNNKEWAGSKGKERRVEAIEFRVK